jgi:hypothetical protein
MWIRCANTVVLGDCLSLFLVKAFLFAVLTISTVYPNNRGKAIPPFVAPDFCSWNLWLCV